MSASCRDLFKAAADSECFSEEGSDRAQGRHQHAQQIHMAALFALTRTINPQLATSRNREGLI